MNKLVEEAKALNIPRRNKLSRTLLTDIKRSFLEVMLFAKTVKRVKKSKKN